MSVDSKVDLLRDCSRLFALKREFQRELNAAGGRDRVRRLPEAGRFQVPDGDAVVRPVDEVEHVHAEDQVLLIVDRKVFGHEPVGYNTQLAIRFHCGDRLMSYSKVH